MAINQKDIKLLWGRSGNKCAFCRTDLTADKKAVTSAFTLGEQAHIVGEKEDAARGKSSLSTKERNSYHNLILLCPTHHTEIDENEEDWPVERLHIKKSEHELWVKENLSSEIDLIKVANDTAVASLIDAAVELCKLDEWQAWTSWALSPDPKWNTDMPDSIFKFREKVLSMIWPAECVELKMAANVLSGKLNIAAQTFADNSEKHGDKLYPFKFYKAAGWNENYDADLKKYTDWVEDCHNLIRDATKAANWFADAVRKEVNPMFYIEKGRFLIMTGPYADLSFKTEVLEYSAEELSTFLGK